VLPNGKKIRAMLILQYMTNEFQAEDMAALYFFTSRELYNQSTNRRSFWILVYYFWWQLKDMSGWVAARPPHADGLNLLNICRLNCITCFKNTVRGTEFMLELKNYTSWYLVGRAS